MIIIDTVNQYKFKGTINEVSMYGYYHVEWDNDNPYPIIDEVYIDASSPVQSLDELKADLEEQIYELANHLLWYEDRNANLIDYYYDWYKTEGGF